MTEQAPTILIVDDEEDLRDAIAFDFRRKKFNVLTAASGSEAIEIVKANGKKISVILTDVRMPNGDGVGLLENVKKLNPFMTVVMFITAFSDISLADAYHKGADAVFSKPFDRKALMSAVERAIQPVDARFTRGSTRSDVDLPVAIHFLASNISQEAKIRNIGRGGFFAELKAPFPRAQEEVQFHIQAEFDTKFMIKGVGVSRWVREAKNEDLVPGCGIEILYLESESLKKMIELLNFLKTTAYIPKN